MVGMGLVMMGPNTYLPTFGQAVLNLSAISAGLLLASMSVGWPIASSLSGRWYLTVGFRDAALAGALLMVVAIVGFLYAGYPGNPVYLFFDQMLLGAGFGLLSTPLLVGVQTTVGWRERGVVTSANIFSRYLGQSLGAALYGALFNHAIAKKLATAPDALRDQLPRELDSVIGALENHQVSGAANDYLRQAMYAATHHVYIGALVMAVLTVFAVMIAPRKFPSVPQ